MKDRAKAVPPITATLTEAILESISDGVFTVDHAWRITSFNRAAEEITGVKRSEALGQHCADVFRSSLCGAECALQRTLNTGEPIIGQSAYIINALGERIPISISTAVLKNAAGEIIGGAEVFRDLSELTTLRQELAGRYRVGQMSSSSDLMQRIFAIVPAVAASSSTVLIQGETGTGKELVARAIHEMSSRSKKPFIAVNCGALPDTLLESELFGYKAGAFTGATKDKPGRFALADGGTLFLDEIGEISPALQVRLLRVLQEHVYEPLGAVKTEKSDVRVIAATHRDLQERSRSGEFREDLYYRINVVRLELPPLRERKVDIPLLAQQFITRFNHLQGKSITALTPKALSLLMAHDWPGNVRELENVIERAFILCRSGMIDLPHLPQEFTRGTQGRSGGQHDWDAARASFDAQAIMAALERSGGNRQAAADELGMHKSTLFRKIRQLGLKLPEQDGRSVRAKPKGRE